MQLIGFSEMIIQMNKTWKSSENVQIPTGMDTIINLEVDFMQQKFASTENLAVGIWHELSEPIKKIGAELHCVKVVESENNFVEYFGN